MTSLHLQRPARASSAVHLSRRIRAALRSTTSPSVQARRIGVAAVHGLVDHTVVYAAIGVVNRRRPFLESVFLAYPATEEYALRYASPRRIRRRLWRPTPTGLMRQNGRWTLMVSVPASEHDIVDQANTPRLAELTTRVERIRALTGAQQASFAGILPRVLHRRGIAEMSSEAEMTARIVRAAIERLRAERSFPHVVVLGAGGFIGARVMDSYAGDDTVHGVEVRTGARWPEGLKGPVLVVNMANLTAIEGQLPHLAPGDTLLNEVYPPPGPAMRQTLKARGVALVHLVGVRGTTHPPLPGAYQGAIPCCAAWDSPELDIVLRRL